MTKQAFDLAESPLYGANLIEAGAGTGKTYTIAGLYLRLILEKKIPVEKILVVTFTEAATQELKERIRKRLKEALGDFERGESEDGLTKGLMLKSEHPERDRLVLDSALRSFDQAAVYTIHGFCQRMLVENAFESGALFDTELVTDTEDLFRDVSTDFYRLHVYPETPMFLTFLHHRQVMPHTFGDFVRKLMKPGIQVIPAMDAMDPSDLEAHLETAFDVLVRTWTLERDSLFSAMTGGVGLRKNVYKATLIPQWFRHMDRYLCREKDPLNPPACLAKFQRTTLEKNVTKGHVAPDFALLDRAEELGQALDALNAVYEHNLLCLKIRALTYMNDEMAKRKESKGIVGFDDLLVRLYRALTGPFGKQLEDHIRSKYDAALIDEFQDTDPIQYGIFSNVFSEENTVLFMIGDPKQAIYGFRGADIFAYMQAARDARSGYSLGFNYRSDKGLVEAVNTVFTQGSRPFVFEDISFEPARSALGDMPLSLTGKPDVPFSVWLLESPAGSKPLAKSAASSMVPGAVAREIVRLLDLGRRKEALIDQKPVRESDMAVLVRTNSEARDMKRVMGAHGIPAVIYDTGNVFHSDEAMELLKVLTAMAMPGQEGLVKGALSTTLMGLSAEDLAGFEREPETLESWMDRFREYHQQWLRFGFIDVYNALIKDRDVRARFMGYEQGERRNTNLSHLAQLLHQASLTETHTPEGLLAFLWEKIQADVGPEEHQLRLERDDDAVKIVTVHKSKGMEYPIVFCPYVWNVTRPRNPEWVMFHEPESNALVCDVGSAEFDDHMRLSDKEALAEEIRLLYVALTRARNRCYMVWGRVSGAENSAVVHLVTGGRLPKSDDELWSSFMSLQDRAGGNLVVQKMPENPGQRVESAGIKDESLGVRTFGGVIENNFKITSFSALSTHRNRPEDEADRDAMGGRTSYVLPEGAGDEKTIFTFPRGAAAGTFLHDIFEHADFTSDDDALGELVEDKLAAYRYEPDWKDCITIMVRQVLETPLNPGGKAFALSSVPLDRRLSELEFYFPLKRTDARSLEKVFARHGVSGFVPAGDRGRPGLSFSPVKGFLKGFVDLVFSRQEQGVERYYIVDWKSNYLGPSMEDYGEDALTRVMDEEKYRLQYHLYVLALHRYLSLRMGDGYRYEEHFGGVYYLFLRGMGQSQSGKNGVFFDLPARELIVDLADLLWGA